MRRACLIALLVLSCDPQADSDYPGEPLLTLSGQVKSDGPLPALEAAMLWQRGEPPAVDQQDLATRAPVQATFPATFTVHLYHPPPAPARRSLAPGEPGWARAAAAAIPQGIAASQIAGAAGGAAIPGPAAGGPADAGSAPDGGAPPPDGGVGVGPATAPPGYGIDPGHWIIHLASDAKEGSLTAYWLGAPMSAGFHLVRVTAVDPKCVTDAELQSCIDDLAVRGLIGDSARSFCLAPYRLSPAPPGEQLLLDLGATGLGPPPGCP